MPTTVDVLFGPEVLLYEQSILQITPCAFLLFSVPIRLFQLRQQSVKILQTRARTVKQFAIIVLVATQLALLIAWSVTPVLKSHNAAAIPAAAIAVVASLALLLLSSIEHTRSIRPSDSINVFLLFSLLFDIPQAQTLWTQAESPVIPSIFTASLTLKALVLYIEARSKRNYLISAYLASSPEALVSIYDRTVLWWMNSLLLQAYSIAVPLQDLSALDPDMAAASLEQDFFHSWNTCEMLDLSISWTLLTDTRQVKSNPGDLCSKPYLHV